jgi:hypothetical protein
MLLDGVAPRSHARRSSPAGQDPPWFLRGGAALEGTLERDPSWSIRRETTLGDARERDPPWSLRGGAALGSAQESKFRGKGLAGVDTMVDAPKSNRRGEHSRGPIPGGSSKEPPP